ncbi:MAG: ParB/RepB/Spo0J family partition protein [Thermoguttaceae bacterium]|nr:ParB/RepB/Spo0J family partition protein [Thermoguttaceae bacterium]
MSKSKRLGKGLGSLLSDISRNAAAESIAVDASEFGSSAAANVASPANASVLNAATSAAPAPAETTLSALDATLSAVSNAPATVPFPTANVVKATPSPTRTAVDVAEDEKERVLDEFAVGRAASEVPIDLIDRNPFQPRVDFDQAEMEELASSVKRHGMIQPIVLRRKGERFEIVAGERRFRAAKLAEWTKVPACLIDVDDQATAELALTENIQRKDLNAIEKAVAFRNYLDQYGGTHDELAKRLDLDRSTVSNLLRLLDLPEEIQTSVRRGELTQGHARALLPLEEWDQLELARRVVDERLSVRQTEKIVQEFLDGADFLPPENGKKTPAKQEVSPRVRDLEQQFRTWLGMKVKLTSNDKGKGKLVVQFNSNDEFERVYQALKPRDF